MGLVSSLTYPITYLVFVGDYVHSAYPDSLAVHVLNLIRKTAAAMWPLTTSSVATCPDYHRIRSAVYFVTAGGVQE